MSVQSGIVTVAVVLTCFWLGNLVMRAVDLLYRPRVRRWVGHTGMTLPTNQDGFADICPKDNCDLTSVYDDEYIKALEAELLRLRSARGRPPKKLGHGQELPPLATFKKSKKVAKIKRSEERINTKGSKGWTNMPRYKEETKEKVILTHSQEEKIKDLSQEVAKMKNVQDLISMKGSLDLINLENTFDLASKDSHDSMTCKKNSVPWTKKKSFDPFTKRNSFDPLTNMDKDQKLKSGLHWAASRERCSKDTFPRKTSMKKATEATANKNGECSFKSESLERFSVAISLPCCPLA